MTALLTVLSVPAPGDPAVDPTTGHGPEWGKAAPVALLIILLMGLALVLLIKSMNKQLGRVPASFGPTATRPGKGAAPAGPGRQSTVDADAADSTGDDGPRTTDEPGPSPDRAPGDDRPGD